MVDRCADAVASAIRHLIDACESHDLHAPLSIQFDPQTVKRIENSLGYLSLHNTKRSSRDPVTGIHILGIAIEPCVIRGGDE